MSIETPPSGWQFAYIAASQATRHLVQTGQLPYGRGSAACGAWTKNWFGLSEVRYEYQKMAGLSTCKHCLKAVQDG